ncbi:MAG: 50S ribosomal protein L11 [Phycisphaerales bacterium]|nr:50S ribosomal protein L11 [Phycisphaerales bacterium]
MAKAKEVVKKFKMQAPGGTATPAPPIGPVLGANGVNPGQFITKFNAATSALKGKVVGVEVTVYSDKSFDFVIKTPPASVMIKDALSLEKGSGEPNKNKVGKLTKAQLKKIAQEKLQDLNAPDLAAAEKIIAGSARSMGVDVVDA